MSEANEALNPTDDGAADAMAQLVAQQEASEQEVVTETETVDEQVDEARASEEAEETEEVTETNPEEEVEETTEVTDASVLEYLPDAIRADFEAASDDDARKEVLDRALMMGKDYTQKTQALADERRELEALRQKAEWWDQATADPLALSALTGDKDAGSAEEEDFDILEAGPEDLRRMVREEAQKLREAEEREAAQSEQADLEYYAELNEALGTYATANGLDQGAMDTLTKRVGQQIQVLGIDARTHITPKNIAMVLDDHRERLELESTVAAGNDAAEKSKRDSTRAARASSPPSQRASTVDEPPSWMTGDRKPEPGEVAAYTKKMLLDSGVDPSQIT